MKPADAAPPGLSCPEPETLAAYDGGRLPAADQDSIARHIQRCPHCVRALEALGVAAERTHTSGNAGSNTDERPAGPHTSTPPTRLGPYELLGPIGSGGMGSVYKARHVHLGKLVALKLLPPHSLPCPAARSRFNHEMKALGRLVHPHIVQAHDAELDDVPYLAMEYVEGIDLARLVNDRGPLPVADACELVRQAALGLQYAHEQGLVHRDVKPSNLILTPAGVVKLLDLGLALLQAREPADLHLTEAGSILGTPDYMAPEQLLDSHTVDIRADLYSLGCTLFQLLVGRPPFGDAEHASFARKRRAHLMEPLPAVQAIRSEIPAQLAAVLARMTAKEPAARFATPAEVAAALRPFCAGSALGLLIGTGAAPSCGVETLAPIVATLPGTVPLRRRRSVHRRVVVLTSLLALVLSGTMLALVLSGTIGGLSLWLQGAKSPTGEVSPHGEAPRVRMEVKHYRREKGRIVSLPPVGGPGYIGAFTEDWVRITVDFNAPMHCYLIAFNPNGAEQLCFPSAADQVPPQARDLLYPTGSSYFPLTDGIGLQAFVVLASRQPLLPYAEWKAARGPVPWQKSEGLEVWRYDGRAFEPLQSGARGGPVQRPVSAPFEKLCSFFRARHEADAVAAVVFPVLPKENPPVPEKPQQ